MGPNYGRRALRFNGPKLWKRGFAIDDQSAICNSQFSVATSGKRVLLKHFLNKDHIKQCRGEISGSGNVSRQHESDLIQLLIFQNTGRYTWQSDMPCWIYVNYSYDWTWHIFLSIIIWQNSFQKYFQIQV